MILWPWHVQRIRNVKLFGTVPIRDMGTYVIILMQDMVMMIGFYVTWIQVS